jgi:GT2 family glycosyltransferase
MTKKLKYTFIVPVKEINEYIYELLEKIKSLKYEKWDMIILPDYINIVYNLDKKIKLIDTGAVGPAEKRDIGAKYANCDVLVFIDDDSYPKVNYLETLNEIYQNDKIIAVGGPAITPRDDDFWQKVSGAVFLSSFSGSAPERYISIGCQKYVDDWPSVNLSILQNKFLEVGGFDSKFWPGEDTLFCQKLIDKFKTKILYDPSLIVYHHRRNGLLRHIKQVGAYGLHRGFLAKKIQNSLKIKYFMPTIFVLSNIILLILSLISEEEAIINFLYLMWFLYSIVLIKSFVDIIKYESIMISIVAIFYILVTHIVYGVKFLLGFFSKNIKSRMN